MGPQLGRAEQGPARRLALLVEYEGTRFHGFQLQTNAPTVQGELEAALERLTGQRTRVQGASRTDAGVHAQGQVVAFTTQAGYSPQVFLRALNSSLSEDIRVRCAYQVALDFDPRRQARRRVYRYTILNRKAPSPLMRRLSYWMPQPLDVEAMARAASLLAGSRDFSALAGPLLEGKRGVRRVYRWEVWREGEWVIIEAEANAFLPQQVRKTAGALARVGLKRLSHEGFRRLLEGAAPESPVPLLPAWGLCLMEVMYSDFPPRGAPEENRVARASDEEH
ncbi:MAG: tRNA pseudouridine(38-40) synthase TruA [Dehalococcoidia bacterium]